MAFTELPVIENPNDVRPPATLVVRYGYMKNVAELPYDGQERMGCGTKVVIRSRRGTELAEVLSTTCTNSTCRVSVPRQQMLDYIAKSGGNDYPFTTEGRVLRVATDDDRSQQSRMDSTRPLYIRTARELIQESELPMELVEVELLLGGEMATFYFMSEHRVDFRNLVKQLAARFHTRIQMHQVGARDEARLVADYETCGKECCCRHFLKVLKPVNMGSAKMQKATLDPNKISGRCGRLKCCLRYEDAVYEDLRKRLPRGGTRVRVADGVGVVEETMILTQLVRLRLADGRVVAVANEDILERDLPESAMAQRPAPGGRDGEPRESASPRPSRGPSSGPRRPAAAMRSPAPSDEGDEGPASTVEVEPAEQSSRGRNRRPERRPERRPSEQPPVRQQPPESAPPAAPPATPESGSGETNRGIGALGRRRRGRGRGRGPGGETPANPES